MKRKLRGDVDLIRHLAQRFAIDGVAFVDFVDDGLVRGFANEVEIARTHIAPGLAHDARKGVLLLAATILRTRLLAFELADALDRSIDEHGAIADANRAPILLQTHRIANVPQIVQQHAPPDAAVREISRDHVFFDDGDRLVLLLLSIHQRVGVRKRRLVPVVDSLRLETLVDSKPVHEGRLRPPVLGDA